MHGDACLARNIFTNCIFVLALKESKGLYDTILYVLNAQEVKTCIGRGRLFLRFCLQNHRLGDVIQQSYMMTKIVR